MPKFKINWNEAMTFEVIPEGIYEATIDTSDCEELESSNGNPMVKIKFNVNVDGKNRVVSKHYVLAGPGLGFLAELVASVGLPFDDVFDTKLIHGLPCKVKITHEEYKGDTRSNVAKTMPSDSLGANQGFVIK